MKNRWDGPTRDIFRRDRRETTARSFLNSRSVARVQVEVNFLVFQAHVFFFGLKYS